MPRRSKYSRRKTPNVNMLFGLSNLSNKVLGRRIDFLKIRREK